MTTIVNVQEAKTRLSQLIAAAERGEEIVVARSGKPAIRLVPVEEPPEREFGIIHMHVPEDILDPLSEEELADWERSL